MGGFTLDRLSGGSPAGQRLHAATNAWTGMVEGLVYRAAGKELLQLMETKPEGVEPKDLMGLAQKYKLNDESLQKLFQQVQASGALEIAQMQQKTLREEMARKEAVKASQKDASRALSSATNTGQFSLESYNNQMSSLHPELSVEDRLAPAKAYVGVENAAQKGQMSDYQVASLLMRQDALAQSKQLAQDRMALQQQIHSDNMALKEMIARFAFGKQTRVPPQISKEIGEKGQAISTLTELYNGFKDNYGGAVIGGPTVTKLSEKFGANKKRVQWWKNFKMLDSKLRNELFGSALTNTEKAAWDEITVTENSNPDIIKQAILNRAAMAQKALMRELQGLSDSGLDTSRLEENVPRMGSPVEVVDPGTPRTIRYDKTGKRIP